MTKIGVSKVRFEGEDVSATSVLRKFDAEAAKAIKNTEKHAKKLAKSFSGLTEASRKFNLITEAIGRVKASMSTAVEAVALKDRIDVTREAFERLAERAGQNANEMSKALQAGSRGTIDSLSAMELSNKGLLLGLPLTSQRMEELGEVSIALGRAMGRTANEALGDLIVGFGRGSALILDNLGITVDTKAAYEKFAASIGKVASELSEAEKKTAVFQAGMEDALKVTEKLDPSLGSSLEKSQQIASLWQDVKVAFVDVSGAGEDWNRFLGRIALRLKTIKAILADIERSDTSVEVGAATGIGITDDEMKRIRSKYNYLRTPVDSGAPGAGRIDTPEYRAAVENEVRLLTRQRINFENAAAMDIIAAQHRNEQTIAEAWVASHKTFSGSAAEAEHARAIMDSIREKNPLGDMPGAKGFGQSAYDKIKNDLEAGYIKEEESRMQHNARMTELFRDLKMAEETTNAERLESQKRDAEEQKKIFDDIAKAKAHDRHQNAQMGMQAAEAFGEVADAFAKNEKEKATIARVVALAKMAMAIGDHDWPAAVSFGVSAFRWGKVSGEGGGGVGAAGNQNYSPFTPIQGQSTTNPNPITVNVSWSPTEWKSSVQQIATTTVVTDLTRGGDISTTLSKQGRYL